MIEFRRPAQREFDAAAERYDGVSHALGDRFRAAVQGKLAEALTKPNRFPIVQPAIREAIVDGFPFSVFFRSRGGRVIVLAVYHHSRDPDGWKNRA